MKWLATWVALFTVSCARPLPVERRDWVIGQWVAHTAPSRDDAKLIRPRFGLPAIEQAGEALAFDVELVGSDPHKLPRAMLLRSDAPDESWPLVLTARDTHALDGSHLLLIVARATLEPGAAHPGPEPGSYDLVLDDGAPQPQRAPRAVWLRQQDPDSLPEVKVAQLSDLHIGKGRHKGRITQRLAQVIDAVNQLGPDVVLVTGDIVESGDRRTLMQQAVAALLRIEAPLLIVPGNHDHGFSPGAFAGRALGDGWASFADAFHPSLYFETVLGGWRFVGFDSGASVFSPFVWTRGVGDSMLRTLRSSLASSRRAGDRGAILFSHAPSRARVTGQGASKTVGLFGRMLWGASEFERVIRESAQAGFRVLHLSGHTHWSDVFEDDGQGAFVRWDRKTLLGGQHEVVGRAALVNAQSATHTTFPGSTHGRGYGFVWLVLREGNPLVQMRRFQ
jgi:Icc-related predicted phosphoesterase